MKKFFATFFGAVLLAGSAGAQSITAYPASVTMYPNTTDDSVRLSIGTGWDAGANVNYTAAWPGLLTAAAVDPSSGQANLQRFLTLTSGDTPGVAQNVIVTATNTTAGGAAITASVPVTVRLFPNAPLTAATGFHNGHIDAGTSVTVTSAPNSSATTYSSAWVNTNLVSVLRNVNTFTLRSPSNAASGPVTLYAVYRDNHELGGVCTNTIALNVVAVPSITGLAGFSFDRGTTGSEAFTLTYGDAHSGLSYEYKFEPDDIIRSAVVTGDGADKTLQLETYPNAFGTVQVTMVTTGNGHSVTNTVTVTVNPADNWADVPNRDTNWVYSAAAGATNTISTPQQLAQFAWLVNQGTNFAGTVNVITQDIDLSAYDWTPAGSSATINFAGTLTAEPGRLINGLTIDNATLDNAGLFGYIGADGVVDSLTLTNNSVNAKDFTGSIAGRNYGTIANCAVSGAVSGNNAVGGIVGANNDGTVANCANFGAVNGGNYTGGIAGHNGSTLANCVNYGAVYGGDSTGGIAGNNIDTLANCVNHGGISGGDRTGAIIGLNQSTAFENSYWNISATNQTLAAVGVGSATDCAAFDAAGGLASEVSAGGILSSNLHSALNRYVLANPAVDGIALRLWTLPDETAALPGLSGDGSVLARVSLVHAGGTNTLLATNAFAALPDGGTNAGHAFTGWTAATNGAAFGVADGTTLATAYYPDVLYAIYTPLAQDDTATAAEDDAVLIDVLVNDYNPDGGLTIIAFDAASAQGAAVSQDAATGLLRYDPGTNAVFHALPAGGQLADTFTYSVLNGRAIRLVGRGGTIHSGNRITVVYDLSVEHGLANGDLLWIDNIAVTVTNVTSATRFSITTTNSHFGSSQTLNGGLAYTHDPADASTATVTVTVGGLNDNPVGVDDPLAATATAGDTVTLVWTALLANDTDIDAGDDNFTVTGVFAEDDVHAITAIAPSADGLSTVVTSPGHGLASGAAVLISGALNPARVNGSHTITVVDADTFTIPVALESAVFTRAVWTPAALSPAATTPHGAAVTLYDNPAGKSIDYNADSPQLKALARGESVVDGFWYVLEDAHGARGIARVSLTVNGTTHWTDRANRDTNWVYSTAAGSTNTISTPQELAQAAWLVNQGTDFAGTVNLIINDIDLSARFWTPIGSAANPFNGTLAAQPGTVVNGLTIDDDTLDYAGLFGMINSAGVVDSITLTNTSIRAGDSAGSVAGMNHGLIVNCANYGEVSGSNRAGGIAGTSQPAAYLPTLVVRDDQPETTGAVADGGSTDDTTPAYQGRGEPGATVRVVVTNGNYALVLNQTTTVDGSGQWVIPTPSALLEGGYGVVMTHTDPAGGTSGLFSSRFTVDTTSPGPAGTLLDVNPLTGNDIINAEEHGRDITVTGTVSGEYRIGDKVTLGLPGGASAEGSVVRAGVWEVTVAAGSLGSTGMQTLTAAITAHDAAGNAGQITVNHSYVVSLPVSISINVIAGDDIVNRLESARTHTLSGSVSGNFSAGDAVAVRAGGYTFQTTLDAAGNWSVASVPGAELASDNKVAVTVTLAGSQTAFAERAYTVDLNAPDNTSTTIEIHDVTDYNVVDPAEAAVVVQLSGRVAGDYSEGDLLTVIINGTRYDTGVNADGSWTVTVIGADLRDDSDRIIQVQLIAHDTAGNEGLVTGAKSYGVDNNAAFAGIDPIAGDNIINAAEAQAGVVFSGRVGGAFDHVVNDQITVTVSGLDYTVNLNPDCTWSLTVVRSLLGTDGAYTVTVKVTVVDGSNNTFICSNQMDYRLDTQGPDNATTSIGMDDVTADNMLSAAEAAGTVRLGGGVAGEYREGDVLTVIVNGTRHDTSVGADGSWHVTVAGADLRYDADRTIQAELSAHDAAGNEGRVTGAKSYGVEGADRLFTSAVINCINHGAVSGGGPGGGITGYNAGLLANNVDSGGATSSNAYAGGISGYSTGTLLNNYWAETAALAATSGADATNCASFDAAGALATEVSAGGILSRGLHSALNRYVLANPDADGIALRLWTLPDEATALPGLSADGSVLARVALFPAVGGTDALLVTDVFAGLPAGAYFSRWWAVTNQVNLPVVNGTTLAAAFYPDTVYCASGLFYVDDALGDDANDGFTRNTAFKTIQAAVDAATQENTVILVTNGTYAPIATGNKLLHILSDEGAEWTVIDGGGAASCAVLGAAAGETNSLLTGFTLRNGSAALGGAALGGTLMNCVLADSSAVQGGGAAYSRLVDCTVTGGAATYGGGVYAVEMSRGTLIGNTADYGGGAYGGTLEGVALRNNTAAYNGGGAMYGLFNRCRFEGNTSGSYGGGLYLATAYNSIFTGNRAVAGGGLSETTNVNCTIWGNTASQSGGGIAGTRSATRNGIVWGNTAPAGAQYAGISQMEYTCTTPLFTGTGNLAADPGLVDPANGDFRLYTTSPAAGTGDPAAVYGALDFAGEPRLTAGRVNMGALEGTVPTGYTTTTPEPVPYAWLEANGLVPANPTPQDYETAAWFDKDGDGHTAWEEYVAGTDPDDPDSVFRVFIEIANGETLITYGPQFSGRTYTVLGTTNLVSPAIWSAPPATNAATPLHFFHATVELD